nr:uncharacterized protein LOC100179290 isoform X1 [Ciona intestinalis]|eukprot:XP_002125823.2 uncharacterized protein LOC100179290 isoform X1 [Ciona intestinalis]
MSDEVGASSPLSYWNAPEILRTLTTEDMYELDTPHIKQMHEPCQPGQHPKSRVASGRFVDWGTKLYQLQLELSYKNNEISILKKKLRDRTNELFPGGNTNKKSVVTTLRTKCDTLERKLQMKNQELKFEQNRSVSVSRELAKVKKEYNELRREKRSNNKAVQTLSTTSKSVQAKHSAPVAKTRNIMTQCSYVSVKPMTSSKASVSVAQTNKTNGSLQLQMTCDANGEQQGAIQRTQVTVAQQAIKQADQLRSGSSDSPQMRHRQQHVVPMSPEFAPAVVLSSTPSRDNSPQYVTEVNINEEPKSRDGEPLQMSFSQEFSDGGVKTYVHSNKNFAITESPYATRTQSAAPVMEKLSASDSGVFTDGYSPDHMRRTTPYPPATAPPTYSPLLRGYNQPQLRTERTFERSVPYYMNNDLHKSDLGSPSSSRTLSKPRNPSAQSFHDSFIASSPRNVFYPGTCYEDPTHGGKIPYYLFRREAGSDGMKRGDKPIYVHTSEISLCR